MHHNDFFRGWGDLKYLFEKQQEEIITNSVGSDEKTIELIDFLKNNQNHGDRVNILDLENK